ncbi:MAG: ATP-binding protein [Chromatiales bacterium]|nr:ATP-binding protein [Chromatiales bacterium]
MLIFDEVEDVFDSRATSSVVAAARRAGHGTSEGLDEPHPGGEPGAGDLDQPTAPTGWIRPFCAASCCRCALHHCRRARCAGRWPSAISGEAGAAAGPCSTSWRPIPRSPRRSSARPGVCSICVRTPAPSRRCAHGIAALRQPAAWVARAPSARRPATALRCRLSQPGRRHSSERDRAGAASVKGTARLCFYGPPGTGKTAFAEVLAEALDRELVARQASDLLSPYVGETEHNLARLFREIDPRHSVLLLDEVDSFLGRPASGPAQLGAHPGQ